ncbi:hypothetical protein D918_08263 [Trichuris suis]|nr:hypothetical protein D918_08263 [Trichuris suis]
MHYQRQLCGSTVEPLPQSVAFHFGIHRRMLRAPKTSGIQTATDPEHSWNQPGPRTLACLKATLLGPCWSHWLSGTLNKILFDLKNPINVMQEHFIFTTEGHPLPLLPIFRSWNRSSLEKPVPAVCQNQALSLCETLTKVNGTRLAQSTKDIACPEWPLRGRHVLPLRSVYMKGLHDSLEVDYPF